MNIQPWKALVLVSALIWKNEQISLQDLRLKDNLLQVLVEVGLNTTPMLHTVILDIFSNSNQ